MSHTKDLSDQELFDELFSRYKLAVFVGIHPLLGVQVVGEGDALSMAGLLQIAESINRRKLLGGAKQVRRPTNDDESQGIKTK